MAFAALFIQELKNPTRVSDISLTKQIKLLFKSKLK